jgi:glucokinase
MFLGVEIGGTKLQLGVGSGQRAEMVALERRDIDARRGAAAILDQIHEAASKLIQKHAVTRVGFGFGGPVRSDVVIKSHQVQGWDGFPLGQWCRETLGLPAVIGNDCDVAALAEARYGAGQGSHAVFYVTVGTGIGGGFVLNGHVYGKGRPAVSEIGHLRPGPSATSNHDTIESAAAGPGIAAAAIHRLKEDADSPDARDLRNRCDSKLEQLTAKHIGEAAVAGNILAREILRQSCQVLGWGIAQVVTLLAPNVVVVGGGVSLIGEDFFFTPLREEVRRFVFPPLADSYTLLPAQLGELVVVHGAIALAASQVENHS